MMRVSTLLPRSYIRSGDERVKLGQTLHIIYFRATINEKITAHTLTQTHIILTFPRPPQCAPTDAIYKIPI